MTAPLDKLHDFYQPAPPAWTPHTIGWYMVFAIAGILILWMVIHGINRWLANRYRRVALRELVALPPQQFSTLLKRTALAAWPRKQVASLSGASWLDFLGKTTKSNLFHSAPGNRMEDIALRPVTLSASEEQQLRNIAAEWIRRHRVQA